MTIKRNGFRRTLTKLAFAAVLTAGLSVPSIATLATTASADSVVRIAATQKTRALTVPIGKPKTFRTDAPFAEIVVGDPSLAIVTPLTDQSFYIVGSNQGTTGIAIFNDEKELIASLDVEVAPDSRQINQDLRAALGETGVKAKTQNGNVVITGKAKSPEAAQKAREIVKKFDKNAVDAVQVDGSTQVQLEVRFVEAQRNASKELGISFGGGKDNGRFLGQTGAVSSSSPTGINTFGNSLISGSTPFGTIISNLLAKGLSVDMLIQALERKGVARRLAEPTLVALSGDTASFIAGGEFPIPVAAGDDQVTIEFKEFGVGLEFTPTVLDNGLINMRIAPEVSAIDGTNSVTFGNSGIQIPALVVRRASTTVELRDGQSFVMAGLLQSTGNYDIRKFPWLGDLPIIGALFRSTAYRKNETDLVIIVTPRLVKPLAPGAQVETPLDKTAPPNDVDLFVDGQTEISRAQLRVAAETDEGILPAGHILDF